MHGSKLIFGVTILRGALAVFLFVATRISVGTEPAEPAAESAPPVEGVLLLREGGVLTGKITQAGDRYFVVAHGSEINVAAAKVELVCRSLAEAYDHRLRALHSPTADAHLALAEWCLRCNLFPQAAEQLTAAQALDAHYPKLALLQRRLAVASQAQADRSAASTPGGAELPATAAELKQPLVGDLSDEAVERFTRKVQRLLVNNCTTAGCHSSGGKQSFQLDRAMLHGMADRRSTRQNLGAVLTLVDRKRPHESPLLVVGRMDHGGLDRPIFGPRQSQQFRQLVEWVGLVTHSDVEALAKPAAIAQVDDVGGSEAMAAAAISAPAESVAGNQVTPAAYSTDVEPNEPSPASGIAAPASNAEPLGLRHTRGTQVMHRGAVLHARQPKDLFDLEIFNRKTARQASRTGR